MKTSVIMIIVFVNLRQLKILGKGEYTCSEFSSKYLFYIEVI